MTVLKVGERVRVVAGAGENASFFDEGEWVLKEIDEHDSDWTYLIESVAGFDSHWVHAVEPITTTTRANIVAAVAAAAQGDEENQDDPFRTPSAIHFVTKDSGARENYASGMVRDSQAGKPRFALLMPQAVPYDQQLLTRWAQLMARGADKYGDRNWEKADGQPELDRALDSAMRHFMQWFHGETDEDHAAAVLFNVQEAEYVKWRMAQ